MTGCIKITATTRNGHEGLAIQTEMKNVSFAERMQILDALCRALELDLKELKLFVALKSTGILDKAITVETIQHESVKGPSADLFDQLLSALFGGNGSEG